MKDIMIERIKEIAQEINDLLDSKKKLLEQMKVADSNIIAKQGAIYELKKLIEYIDSIEKE